MIKIIFIKELQSCLLNRSMLFTWALITGLFILNASVSVIQYRDRVREHETIVLKNNQKLAFDAAGGGANKEVQSLFTGEPYEKVNSVSDMVLLKQKLSSPPSPFTFISGSVEGLVPDGAGMNLFEEPEFASFARFNPYMNSYFSIDYTNLMIYIISFFCICFSYNAFSGEKEDGTLRLMLSNSVSRASIIIAKFLGLLTVFLIPLLLGFMISCLIFELSPALEMGVAEYAKTGYFFFVSALLICLTLLTGFVVSALTQRSYVSLIVCLVCWAVMAIIIPNVSWIVTAQTDKIPAESAVYLEEAQQKRDLKDCYTGWRMDANGVPEEVALARKACIDRQTAIHNSLWREYHNQQFEQTRKAILISKVSPFGLFRFLGDKIAGTNYYGYAAFFEQVNNYQLNYQEYIIAKDQADPESRHLIWNEGLCTSLVSQQNIDPADVPKFTMQPSSFREVIADSLGDVFILCLWCIVLFAISFIAFVKYDVR
ncbi:MAG: ABC transporter permease [Tannerella sp.]|jgi:ABC-type transport system involved in multi-copper enzyme maturation permease subunit|nr:ABC transporter permease [Tannerella sp.]